MEIINDDWILKFKEYSKSFPESEKQALIGFDARVINEGLAYNQTWLKKVFGFTYPIVSKELFSFSVSHELEKPSVDTGIISMSFDELIKSVFVLIKNQDNFFLYGDSAVVEPLNYFYIEDTDTEYKEFYKDL